MPHVLYRATDTRAKLSTKVSVAEAPGFHPAYMNVVKGSMSSLKKVQKKKATQA